MAYGEACQVWTEGVIVQQLGYICHAAPRGSYRPLVGRLCGSFVLRVYTLLYVAATLSLLSTLAQGGLLHPQPTPAVMVAEPLKTHAQICNRFSALCLAEM